MSNVIKGDILFRKYTYSDLYTTAFALIGVSGGQYCIPFSMITPKTAMFILCLK